MCILQMALESDAEVAYARLGALCQAIKNELQNDLNIHDASILPAYVNLPQVTAAEYSQVPHPPISSDNGWVQCSMATACLPPDQQARTKL